MLRPNVKPHNQLQWPLIATYAYDYAGLTLGFGIPTYLPLNTNFNHSYVTTYN